MVTSDTAAKKHLIPGAVLSRPKAGGLIEHEGLYVGSGQVFHNTPERGDHFSTLAEFARNHNMRIRYTDSWLVPAVLSRAQQLARMNRRYDVATYNCQHSVRKALGWTVESPQAKGWTIAGFATPPGSRALTSPLPTSLK